eukprot:gene7030-12656_t
MAGRFEVMIIATGMLTLAFIMACVSTGSNGWVRFEQSGKDPTIISLWADQGLFEQCVKTRLRGRAEVSNCYSVSSTYNGQTQDIFASRRKIKRRDDNKNESCGLSNEDEFKINVLYVALDSVLAGISLRFRETKNIASTFSFLYVVSYVEMEETKLSSTVKEFAANYATDVSPDLLEEMIQLRHLHRLKFGDVYWEKAVAGLMVTATVIMGIAVVLSGFLMLSSEGRSGILSDVSPVIIGNIAAVIAVIALIIYNSKYESIRNKLIGVSEKEYVDDEVTFGYSLYVGWLSSFIHFINIFFYFIYKAWAKHTLEKRRKGKGLEKHAFSNLYSILEFGGEPKYVVGM